MLAKILDKCFVCEESRLSPITGENLWDYEFRLTIKSAGTKVTIAFTLCPTCLHRNEIAFSHIIEVVKKMMADRDGK